MSPRAKCIHVSIATHVRRSASHTLSYMLPSRLGSTCVHERLFHLTKRALASYNVDVRCFASAGIASDSVRRQLVADTKKRSLTSFRPISPGFLLDPCARSFQRWSRDGADAPPIGTLDVPFEHEGYGYALDVVGMAPRSCVRTRASHSCWGRRPRDAFKTTPSRQCRNVPERPAVLK